MQRGERYGNLLAVILIEEQFDGNASRVIPDSDLFQFRQADRQVAAQGGGQGFVVVPDGMHQVGGDELRALVLVGLMIDTSPIRIPLSILASILSR